MISKLFLKGSKLADSRMRNNRIHRNRNTSSTRIHRGKNPIQILTTRFSNIRRPFIILH